MAHLEPVERAHGSLVLGVHGTHEVEGESLADRKPQRVERGRPTEQRAASDGAGRDRDAPPANRPPLAPAARRLRDHALGPIGGGADDDLARAPSGEDP